MISQSLINKISKYIDNNYEGQIDIIRCNSIPCETLEGFPFEPEASFLETLLKLIDNRKINDTDVYKAALVDRRLFSKIRSNIDYQPSKRIALSFCVALKLNIDEAEDLLERAGFALSHSDRTDLIVRFYLEEQSRYDINKVNETLLNFDCKPLTKY